MRKQPAVLLFLILLCAISALLYFKTARKADDRTQPVYREALPPQDISYTRPLSELPEFSGPEESAFEKVITKNLPLFLTGKEGISTNPAGIFQAGNLSSLHLRSEWVTANLFPTRTLPLMSIRIRQAPDTGEYRISGGTLALPGTGLEAGCEAELHSDEYKATLQWKKSF